MRRAVIWGMVRTRCLRMAIPVGRTRVINIVRVRVHGRHARIMQLVRMTTVYQPAVPSTMVVRAVLNHRLVQ